MPNNFWIAGWGVAFILAALLYSEKVTDRAAFGNAKAQQENKGRADQQPIASSNRPPAPTYNRQPPPKEYKPNCSKREDADLCTQRRMAVAAEEQLAHIIHPSPSDTHFWKNQKCYFIAWA